MSATAHLTPMEDLTYRRLIDLYYINEGPLCDDMARLAKLLRLKGQEKTIRAMLDEFFLDGADGWHHERCEAEIMSAQDKRTKAQESAAKRWDKERNANASANAMRTHTEGNAPNPNPNPNPKNTAMPTPDGVDNSVWQDFLKIRKAKKAPMTETALDGIRREAKKAGMTLADALSMCCARGWQGFEAKWLVGQIQGATQPLTVPSKTGIDPALAKAIQDGLNATKPPEAVRARLAEFTGRKAA